MKIVLCKNRFEVIADSLEHEEAEILLEKLQEWIEARKLPSDEQYMAALGPCGK